MDDSISRREFIVATAAGVAFVSHAQCRHELEGADFVCLKCGRTAEQILFQDLKDVDHRSLEFASPKQRSAAMDHFRQRGLISSDGRIL